MLVAFLGSCALVSDADLASRMDLDGDGVSRPADCNDDDATVGAAETWFVDADLDGYGGTGELTGCAPDEGVSAISGDCDDANVTTFPGATEACDNEDNDCDGVVDDGVEPPTWYFDGDGDGFGTGATTKVSCAAPAGYVAVSGDCNDADGSLNPDTPWYPDLDGDGYGDTEAPTLSSDAPPDLILDGTDCDDADPTVSPAGQEVCDEANADEDCDGLADNDDPSSLPDGFHPFYADTDGDGYGDASALIDACDAPLGYVSDGRDCDDSTTASGIECGWIDVSAARALPWCRDTPTSRCSTRSVPSRSSTTRADDTAGVRGACDPRPFSARRRVAPKRRPRLGPHGHRPRCSCQRRSPERHRR